MIDTEFRQTLPRPVTLAEIKKETSLREFALVRLPRLSVMPVSEDQWKTLMKLGGVCEWR